MKFKLGDKVRVKDELYGSNSKIADKYKCRGKVGTVVTIALRDKDEVGYEIDIAPGYCFYADSLEPYKRYKVGDRVVAIDNLGLHPDGSRGIITAIFQNPPRDDEFDYYVKYDDGNCLHGRVYNDDGVLTSKVESYNIDGLNDEFEAIGVRFVEMVE